VGSGDRQLDGSEVDASQRGRERGGSALHAQVVPLQIGVVGEAGRHDLQAGGTSRDRQGTCARIVGTQHDETSDARDELVEGSRIGLDRAVVVEVIGVDVGDDRPVGLVDQEGAIALVRLRHQQIARTEPGVRAEARDLGPDRVRRLGTSGDQRTREHRGGRGLAVRAGHRDRAATLHDRAQTRRARPQPQAAPHRLDDLGIVVADGRRGDDGVDAVELRRIVTDVARDALGPQRRDDRGVEGVAAADDDALLRHEPGYRRQTCAADADEVHVPQLAHRRDV
jgi:hypothetical protein